MATTYNTVKTTKIVEAAPHAAARRAIDACPFLTPETERAIDLALGIGSSEVTVPKIGKVEDNYEVFTPNEVEDIMDAAGPSDTDMAKLEEEESVDAPR